MSEHNESIGPVVRLRTNFGDIRVQLDSKKAPVSTDNFLQYVRDGHYDGTIFHRVIPGFMIQGGGMDARMREKKNRGGIRNEAGNGLRNARGTLAMARTGVVDSATSQFFINLKDNAFLNHRDESAQGFGYAVFGRVVEGMEVVDKIAGVSTGNQGMHSDVPQEPVVIENATVEQ
jgi:cyclophilin family peptidyl-prolyl cis-trans isomerase